jgi:hypothetical protein
MYVTGGGASFCVEPYSQMPYFAVGAGSPGPV